MGERTHVDAIVVGAGAAGMLAAAELAKGGVKVICLDKGRNYSTDEFKYKHDELRYYGRGELVPGMKTDPMTWRPDDNSDAELLPWAQTPLGTSDPLHLPPSLGTGGGSLHWGGACWRFREPEFQMLSTIRERVGVDRLPDNHTLTDWPISYADIEPYYDRVEWELGISGAGSNIYESGSRGDNPWEPPRHRGYPMPPLRQGASDYRFASACEQLGFHPFRTAAGINSVPYNDRPACTYCGFCHGYPCHVDAKLSTNVTSQPEGLATGNLEIRERCRVYRVETDEAQKCVTGVHYIDAEGRDRTLTADKVILACYALENARLLLASGIDGNGQVGKHLMTHAFGFFMGLTPEPSNPFMGPLVASTAVEDFSGELAHEHDPQATWGAPIISWPGDYQPLEIAHALPPRIPRWGADFRDWMRDNFRRITAMYSQTANIPTTETYVDLDPKVKDPFGQPALRMNHAWHQVDRDNVEFLLKQKRRIAEAMELVDWWEETTAPGYHLSTHEVGTHRMGDDPATSVVNRYGESHQYEGLFAIGGGQFPSYHGYNPTQTIQALTYITTDHILGRPWMDRKPTGYRQ